MSDKEKTAEQFFKEYGEVTRKYDLTETVQIPYSHIIELMQGYSKHQMSKELEEAEKEIENNYMLEPGSDADLEIGEEYTHKEQGAKWLLNHLKKKIG